MSDERFVLALAGGVGGGKLARGLAAILPPEQLAIAVNTADDFVHLGLHISPDVDSVLYALADQNDLERGWGLAGETWNFMAAMERLGGETWFKLGDRDLATHILRTEALAAGRTLSEVTALLAVRLGIAHTV
ncbi:MAG: 2-phospho-L-lactate transferase, partial [Alphaproteobacteria bacterium]|nr:2-phospho-L-lactate transferase [Alphaproteobacteria bacterium]